MRFIGIAAVGQPRSEQAFVMLKAHFSDSKSTAVTFGELVKSMTGGACGSASGVELDGPAAVSAVVPNMSAAVCDGGLTVALDISAAVWEGDLWVALNAWAAVCDGGQWVALDVSAAVCEGGL